MIVNEIKMALQAVADTSSIASKSKYFRTGPGEYGEGDQFIGVTVPQVRVIVKQFWERCPISACEQLLETGFHEERLASLLIMVKKFEKADEVTKEHIVISYLRYKEYVNNWDLVDSSSFQILGAHLLKHPDLTLLPSLAQSGSLWDRRIAILATFAHIRAERFEIPLQIVTLLLHDKEDLIHKAVGWMIREIGCRSLQVEREFLTEHSLIMPRTMLRYAIEKFPEDERKQWLKGTIR